jgi:hypothetical protein
MIGLASAALALLVGTVAFTAGWNGLLYLPFWLAAAAPGIPLGLRAVGRSASGLAMGLATGYGVSCLACWAAIRFAPSSAAVLVFLWIAGGLSLIAAAFAIRRPVITLPAWDRSDRAALVSVLALVCVLMAVPYHNVGATDADGRRYYRAYFTADFVWHMALTSELRRFEMPPVNPYLAPEPLHYYWTYFLVPAAVTGVGPKDVRSVEDALKTNAIATALVLAASFYAFAATAVRRRMAAAAAVALVILAASAEGLALIVNQITTGRSLAMLRAVNVDAVTAWWYDGLRIDGVHRTMFYTPQHGMSCALGLLALVIPSVGGAAVTPAAAGLAGVLLGLSTAFNPFLGAAFCVVYGLSVLIDLIVNRRPLASLPVHALAALPPVLAVAWSIVNAMGDGAGAALTIGWVGYARNAPIRTLLLSVGPVLVPALAGFWPDRRLPGQPARTAAVILIVSLLLLYFVMLSDRSWVGFRAGQLLLASLTVPIARLLDRLLQDGRRPLAIGLVCAILCLGLPTTAVDVYNAADITNTAMGPGFPWTVVLSREQGDGLAWIQRSTPPDAVVQAEPFVRGRTQWSLIPSFAERRMAAGLPISLLSTPEYAAGARKVQSIFRARSAADAHQTARQLAIQYLWVDGDDRRAYGPGIAVLDSAPSLFTPVFREGEVSVYAVRD